MSSINWTPDEPIDAAEGGATVREPGWFRCVVEEAGDDIEHEGQTKLKFIVTHGRHRNSVIWVTLTHPDLAASEKAAKAAKSKYAIYLHRLGLWDGVSKEVTADWGDCVGREMVLELEPNHWKDKTTGEERTSYRPTFAGIYHVDDDRIPEAARKACGLPPVKSAATEEKANGKAKAAKPKGAESSGGKAQPPRQSKPKPDYGDI